MRKENKKYSHIKKSERLEISILLKKGYGVREIARALQRSPGTISEEIKRNSTKGVYDPCKADHKAYVKRKYSKYQGMKVEGDGQLRGYVEEKIEKDWSPEQVAGRLKNHDTHIKYASREAIYKFVYSVYGRRLERYLRYKGKKKKTRKREKVTQLKNRTFIDKRPEIVNKRQRYGDFEGDFIVSGKNGKEVLLVLYERKARYTVIRKIMSRNCERINQCLQEMLGIFICFHSLTLDNDISFRKHEELSKLLGTPIYFCHPYHSWEKGGVENVNKLIRQYVPKGSDISKYSDEYIKEIELKLNNRPRKCLGYKTPLEVMIENNQFKTLEGFDIINENKKQASVRLEG
jgi:IS30 family transposase